MTCLSNYMQLLIHAKGAPFASMPKGAPGKSWRWQPFPCMQLNILCEPDQHHVSWCPDFCGHQAISSHDLYHVGIT